MKYLVHFHITEQGWAEIVDANSNQDAKEKGIAKRQQINADKKAWYIVK